MRGTRWVAGVAGAAGLVAGAVLAAPTGAEADSSQFDRVVANEVTTGHLTIDRPDDRRVVDIRAHSSQGAVTIINDADGVVLTAQRNQPTANTWLPAILAASVGTGRGLWASGQTAQVTLEPAQAKSHPKSGLPGDLFVDGKHRLWFRKGGTEWKQIA